MLAKFQLQNRMNHNTWLRLAFVKNSLYPLRLGKWGRQIAQNTSHHITIARMPGFLISVRKNSAKRIKSCGMVISSSSSTVDINAEYTG